MIEELQKLFNDLSESMNSAAETINDADANYDNCFKAASIGCSNNPGVLIILKDLNDEHNQAVKTALDTMSSALGKIVEFAVRHNARKNVNVLKS